MVKTKTSKDSWQVSLGQVLGLANKSIPRARLAIVGIGNELNGDDAAGVLIVRKIAPLLESSAFTKTFEAGQALENITGALIRYKPDIILFIDALSMGVEPGSIHMLDWQSSQGFSASTHGLPLNVVIEYLQHEHPCQVFLIGIQVLDTNMGVGISDNVSTAIDRIVNTFKTATTS